MTENSDRIQLAEKRGRIVGCVTLLSFLVSVAVLIVLLMYFKWHWGIVLLMALWVIPMAIFGGMAAVGFAFKNEIPALFLQQLVIVFTICVVVGWTYMTGTWFAIIPETVNSWFSTWALGLCSIVFYVGAALAYLKESDNANRVTSGVTILLGVIVLVVIGPEKFGIWFLSFSNWIGNKIFGYLFAFGSSLLFTGLIFLLVKKITGLDLIPTEEVKPKEP